MFVLRPNPKSNVIPIRPDVRIDIEAAANRARLERDDRRVLLSTVIALAVMFAFAFGLAALLVWSERGYR
jgi:hypothetical protein